MQRRVAAIGITKTSIFAIFCKYFVAFMAMIASSNAQSLPHKPTGIITASNALGVFVGYPDINVAANMNAFNTSFNLYIKTMGYKPSTMNIYGDWNAALGSYWYHNAYFAARSIQASSAKGIVPIVSIGLGDPRGFTGEDASIEMFNSIAAGHYDYVWISMMRQYKLVGIKSLYLRIGYEQNGGTYFPWFATRDAATAAAYVAAFQRVARVSRAVKGIQVKTVWSPAEVNWTGYPTENTYPGDSVVDVMALDVSSNVWPTTTYDWVTNKYDQILDAHTGTLVPDWVGWAANDINRQHFWDYPSANAIAPTGNGTGWGFQQAWQFAKAHGKPFAIAETGAGRASTGAQGLFDDQVFPRWLNQRLQTVRAAGVPVAFVEIWARNAGGAFGTDVGFLAGERPLEAVEWVKLAVSLQEAP